LRLTGGRRGDRRRERQSAKSVEANVNSRALAAIKLVHTAVWAMFAGCIVAIPVLAWQARFVPAAVLACIVLVEVVVLWLNGWRCPLTDLAARHTEDRRANFDIYLPEWLARYNKQIFGPLYGLGLAVLAIRWMAAAG
jgi:hypothetical protein